MFGCNKQFKAKFAGIPGTRDHDRRTVLQDDRSRWQQFRVEGSFEGEVDHLLENRDRVLENPSKDARRERSLDIHLADRIGMILDFGTGLLPCLLPLQVCGDGATHGCVDHDHIVCFAALIDNGIINDPGSRIEKNTINAAAWNQRRFLGTDTSLQIFGQTTLQQRAR